MASTVSVNGLTVVHKNSGGTTTAFPDVCKTPTPGGPVPIPYPNVSQSRHTAAGSGTVRVDGNPIMLEPSHFSLSTGDEPGSALGVLSNRIKGKAYPKMYSFDVKVEGENVFRLGDLMLCNSGSPGNAAGIEMQPPLVTHPPKSDPRVPRVIKLAWSKTEACCGDEVELQIQTQQLDGTMNLPVQVATKHDPAQTLAIVSPEVKENAGIEKWLVERGPHRPEVTLGGQQTVLPGETNTPTNLLVKGLADFDLPLIGPAWMSTPKWEWTAALGWTRTREDPWCWEVCYQMGIKNGSLVVTRKIEFRLLRGARPFPKQLEMWKREIEAIWDSRFVAHRVDCRRGDSCSCEPGNGCCKFPISIKCEFGPGHGQPVSLYAGGNGTKESGRWWTSHTWFEYRFPPSSRLARPHEFGHLIGLYDEYAAGAVDPARRFAKDDDESIMGSGNTVHERHLDPFFEWLQERAEPVLGKVRLMRRI